MTIAQALRKIKSLKGKMSELSARALSVVSWTTDQKPVFDFATLRGEIARVRDELVGLEAAVAKANANAIITFEGRPISLAEAIRRLQEFKAEMTWLSQLNLREGIERRVDSDWDEEHGRPVRRNVEITWETALKETQRVSELDALRERFAALNDLVESANHRTEVIASVPAKAA